MCKTTESIRQNFAENFQSFFDECFMLNDRIELTKDRYLSNLSFLFSVFENMDRIDFYSTAEKKKFVSELITSVKECQSCISKLSTKIQQLSDLTDEDYRKSSVG